MKILYIGSNEICLLNDDFKTIKYFSEKHQIDYKKLFEFIDNNTTIFINSFFEFSEYKGYSAGLTQEDIFNNIQKQLSGANFVCGNYNHLFYKGRGGEHKNDVVLTFIKEDDSEHHIKKIIKILQQKDLDLSRIYSFSQALHTIGTSYSIFNKTININVVILDDSAMITVSNTTHYMFGRLIKKKENEEIIETITRVLPTVIKYIQTTYLFLQNDIKISILSQSIVDIDSIKNSDQMLKNINFEYQQLKIPAIKLLGAENITTELQLIKLCLGKLKNVNNLKNKEIRTNILGHKIIKYLRLVAGVFVIISVLYFIIRVISGSALSISDKKIEEEYNDITKQYKQIEVKLFDAKNNIYYSIAKELKGNITDNSHLDTMYEVADLLKKHRDLLYIEEYRLSCTNCSTKERKNKIYVEFAFHNVNSSAKYAISKLSEIEVEITTMLKKKYKYAYVSFLTLSKNKAQAAKEDVRDIMEIEYSNV